ncbi:MAG TPA: DUF202 domain-containing protein [Caulobacteraceae bacterium]|nr:DUF202 domain-containing protein [Caulobacteraceae bacterium]
MIRNFSDHAANERTFLAWVRTAIALMAFGFLVEKFDLFLRIIALQGVGRHAHVLGAVAGLLILLAGVIMAGLATGRFLQTARDIDSGEEKVASGARLDVALAGLLVLLGVSLFAYLAYTLVTGG